MAAKKRRTEAEVRAENDLRELAAEFIHDPYGFVCTFFAWDEGPLEGQSGPDEWQSKNLKEIGAKLRAAISNRDGDSIMPILDAVAAANGVGKSAELAWIFWWLLCTHPDTVLIVTANTQNQLLTKTQPEIAKWHKLLICGHWFEVTATKVTYVADPGHAESWRANFIPWNKSNVSAFQGQHNYGKRLAFLIDEASGVAAPIWRAIYGSLTDGNTEIFLIARANPLERDGEFYHIFTGPQRTRWNLTHVSGWESKATNKAQLAAWRDEYGEGSDFYKVRVLGQFPSASSLQFISADEVRAARLREPASYPGEPLIIGADIARHGQDSTRIVFRRGLDARSIPSIKLPYVGNEHGHLMQVAARLAQEKRERRADAIFVDATGMGWGVVDALKQMKVSGVFAIGFGDKPLGCWDKVLPWRPRDRKAEIWGAMKCAMPHLAIEDAQELENDLCGPQYYFDGQGQVFIEAKEEMAARGLASPDWAEGLACTYGAPVEKVSNQEGVGNLRRVYGQQTEYSVWDDQPKG